MKKLAAQGRWLDARELGEELLKRNPADRGVKLQLKTLDRKAREGALNLDFNPRRYFYAEAYLDYFENRSYAGALDALDQVLALDQSNAEARKFREKAAELAAPKMRFGPQPDELVQSGRSVGAPPSPAAADPESVYRDALKAYVRKDLPKARDLLRGLLAREPDNERWQKSLQRIEKELPKSE